MVVIRARQIYTKQCNLNIIYFGLRLVNYTISDQNNFISIFTHIARRILIVNITITKTKNRKLI